VADIPELINILREARSYLQRGRGDYSWSSWEDDQAALAEIDEIIRGLLIGETPPTVLNVLFAPTGPMQEVSLSSGWSNEFVALADRFDVAMATRVCACIELGNIVLEQLSNLGMDKFYGEVSILKCPNCQQLWLRYLYENESVSGSGRWFACPISDSEKQTLTPDSAVKLMNSKSWFYSGGSYFNGVVSRSQPPVILN